MNKIISNKRARLKAIDLKQGTEEEQTQRVKKLLWEFKYG